MELPAELTKHLELNGNKDMLAFAKQTWQQLESHAAQGPDSYRQVLSTHSKCFSNFQVRISFLVCKLPCHLAVGTNASRQGYDFAGNFRMPHYQPLWAMLALKSCLTERLS